ncbi:hypothetical protein Pelo_13909 [Pelomyxa schiedti]|nr:hypothetical protein Pelo_13909 [Pelomyxa schiedti]
MKMANVSRCTLELGAITEHIENRRITQSMERSNTRQPDNNKSEERPQGKYIHLNFLLRVDTKTLFDILGQETLEGLHAAIRKGGLRDIMEKFELKSAPAKLKPCIDTEIKPNDSVGAVAAGVHKTRRCEPAIKDKVRSGDQTPGDQFQICISS